MDTGIKGRRIHPYTVFSATWKGMCLLNSATTEFTA